MCLLSLSIINGLSATPYTTDLSLLSVFMEEICFNGLDDDEDGLYDAFDPDCTCTQEISTDTLVPNGHFERYDECCIEMATQAGVCLDDWFLVTLSPDFVSPDCSSDIGLFDQANISYDGSFIDIGFSSNPTSEVRSESMGVCLNQGLSQGDLYTISFSTAILTALEFGDRKDELFTIYGLPTCPDVSDIDVLQGFCESRLFAQAQEIATVRLFDTERDVWVNHMQNFQPEFEINSIVLYANCDQGQLASSGTFLFLDNIDIIPVAQLSIIEGEILRIDGRCGGEVTLVASSPLADSYQWYKDSIPIVGATDSLLQVIPTNATTAYTVYVSNSDDCLLLDPAMVVAQQFTDQTTIIYDTLCVGGEYTFYDSLILDAGIYTEVLGQTRDGCDSLAILNLYFHPIISSVFDIQPGLILNAGDSLIITPDADFLTQLSSFQWLDQGVPINGSNSRLSVTSDIDQIRNYTFEFVGIGGCELTTGLSAEWILQPPVDEDCSNGIDDDLDGLIDNFDDDCPCTMEQSDQVVLSETICQGSTFLFNGDILDEAGIYRDTFVNILNCDSIVTLDLIIIDDYQDTIDISITEGESYNFEGIEYNESGIYSFTIEDDIGSCDSIFYLNLTVIPPFAIYIPNIISLSSATGNDEFLISSNREVSIVQLLVYNRWGNIVHNGGDFNIDEEDTYIWNGYYNGQPVSQGLYIYKLTYDLDEVRRTIVGDVTVIN